MLWKIGSAKRRTAHCRLSRSTSPVRPKANQYRSVWMPNNSVSIRRARRLELAKSLRRQLRLRRRRVPHLRKRLSALRHLPTKPSLKTRRIANTSIGGPRRLINFPVPRLPLSSRRERALITRIRSEREANSQGAADQLLGGTPPGRPRRRATLEAAEPFPATRSALQGFAVDACLFTGPKSSTDYQAGAGAALRSLH